MKPYVVLRYKNDPVAFHFRAKGAPNAGLAFGQTQNKCDYASDINDDSDFYFTDTKADADHLIQALTVRYPYHSWMLCETKVVFHREPGKLNKAVFTERGLMPE